jgi:hypothetical protein
MSNFVQMKQMKRYTKSRTPKEIIYIAAFLSIPVILTIITLLINARPNKNYKSATFTINNITDEKGANYLSKEKYQGEIIEFEGIVSQKGKDSSGKMFIVLSERVRVTLQDIETETFNKVKSGDTLVFSAVCEWKGAMQLNKAAIITINNNIAPEWHMI